MSHDPNRPNQPEVQARQHAPAIIAILVALAMAALAFMFFGGANPPANDVTQREVPGGGTAEGTDARASTPAVAPSGGSAPPVAEGQPAPAAPAASN